MPPRAAPRGGPRGSGPAIRGGRGGGAPRGGAIQIGLPSTGSHITTVGVKRPNFGTGGRELSIHVNSFQTTIPEGVIHHYDGKSLSTMSNDHLLIFFLVGQYIYLRDHSSSL